METGDVGVVVGVVMATVMGLFELAKLLIGKLGNGVSHGDIYTRLNAIVATTERLEANHNDADSKFSTVHLKPLPGKVKALHEDVENLRREVHENSRDMRGVIDRNTTALHELARALTELKGVVRSSDNQ